MTIVKESTTSTTDFNNYTEEKSMDIEERLIELVKFIPYNKLVIKKEDNKYSYKYDKNFNFIVERRGIGSFQYFIYSLNGVTLSDSLGYVIRGILEEKDIQRCKKEYKDSLEKLVEEIQK